MAKKTRDRDRAAAPRPRNDAYTAMVFITFVALAVGCTLMYLDYDEYGKNSAPKEPVPTLPKLGDDTGTKGKAKPADTGDMG